MTDDNMSLRDLLEKTADTDFLREMIGFTAQRLMELEIEARSMGCDKQWHTGRAAIRRLRGELVLAVRRRLGWDAVLGQ